MVCRVVLQLRWPMRTSASPSAHAESVGTVAPSRSRSAIRGKAPSVRTKALGLHEVDHRSGGDDAGGVAAIEEGLHRALPTLPHLHGHVVDPHPDEAVG